MTTFSGQAIKLDITYYNASCSDVERADVESAELTMEAKFNEENDLFEKVQPDKR